MGSGLICSVLSGSFKIIDNFWHHGLGDGGGVHPVFYFNWRDFAIKRN